MVQNNAVFRQYAARIVRKMAEHDLSEQCKTENAHAI
jgi:hypothetical protein